MPALIFKRRRGALALSLGVVFALSQPHLARAETRTEKARVTSAPGAMLRGLDKVSGVVSEIDIAVGQTVALG